MDQVMEKDQVKTALLTTSLGQLLSIEELNTLIANSRIITFTPGEFILQQGKINNGMYVIIDGTALVTAKILGEGGTYIATLGHGNLIGEVSLIEKSPSATSVIASTYVQALFISNHYFEILDVIYPETKYKITRAITNEVCSRIIDIHSKIMNFMSQSEMLTRSMFSEVIKSFTKLTPAEFSETDVSVDLLKKERLFEKFCQKEFEFFMLQTQLYKAPKNCTLIQEQQSEPSCFLILRGAVQSSIVTENKIAKLSVVGPVRLISNITVIDEKLSSIINYTTCERSVVLKLNAENLIHIRSEYRSLWYKFFDLVCKSFIRLEHAADKLDVRLNSELYNR